MDIRHNGKTDFFSVERVWRNTFRLLSLVAFGFAIFGVIGQAQWHESWMALLMAGAICAIFSYVDRLASLSFGTSGLKAELRAAIDDANATVSQLHELGAQMGAVMVNMLSTAGLWASDQSFKNQDRLKAQILDSLAGLKLPASRIAEVSRADTVQVSRNYLQGILAQTKRALEKEQRHLIVEYQRGYADAASVPDPTAVESFIGNLGVSDTTVDDLLLDYRYYEEKGEHRRPQVWSDRNSWMFWNG